MVKLTQADLVNEDAITVCFSDGTVGLYTAATLLACAVTRVPAYEIFAEHHLTKVHSCMPEDKLNSAIRDTMRRLPDQS